MKKILLSALTLLTVVACSKFDDSEIWSELNDHEERIVKLETLCNQMNTNITSLQTIIIALQNNDYVTNIAPIKEGSKEIGYTINFAKSGSITIYHGLDGKDGENGKDGINGQDGDASVISVKQDTDGTWYWTLNGVWLFDESGNKIPTTGQSGKDGKDGENGTDGITPQLKIEDSYWLISYDNGQTWDRLGKAVGEDGKAGDSFFKSVIQDDENVYITLADGTEFILTKTHRENVIVELSEVRDDSVIFNIEVIKTSVDLKVTVYYALKENLTLYKYDGRASITEFSGSNYTLVIEGLEQNNIYYYFVEVISNGSVVYSPIRSFVIGNIYVDEYGINQGQGIEFGGIIWAPVNCGYHESYFKYGKLYQWGRKYGQGYDGTGGDSFFDNTNTHLIKGPIELNAGLSKDNADEFYYVTMPPYDWWISCDTNLWNEGTEDYPIKTQYDPCPVGWRIPTSAELQVLISRYWKWTTENDQNGYWFSYASYEDKLSRVFLPASGFRSYDEGNAMHRNSNGFYWSSEMDDADNACGISFNKNGVYNMSFNNRAYGKSVRCVKE